MSNRTSGQVYHSLVTIHRKVLSGFSLEGVICMSARSRMRYYPSNSSRLIAGVRVDLLQEGFSLRRFLKIDAFLEVVFKSRCKIRFM